MQLLDLLTKEEALRLECLRLAAAASCPELRSEFYEFVTERVSNAEAVSAKMERASERLNSAPAPGGLQTTPIDIKHSIFIPRKVLAASDNFHKIEGNSFWRSAIGKVRHVYAVGHNFFLSLVVASPTIAGRDEDTSLTASRDNMRDSAI